MIAKKWRDAATLVIAVRSQGNAYKILMLKRSSKSKFMPNAYVFPGGVKSEADFSPQWNSILPESKTSNMMHSNIFSTKTTTESTPYHENAGVHPKIGYRICALRETFEESGLLIANDDSNDGEQVVLSNPNEHIGGEFTTLREWRKNVHNDASNFIKLFQNLKLSPAIGRLMEWSTWLTPTFEQYRYNTMFYLTCLDGVSDILEGDYQHCEEEMSETKWIDTGYALSNLQDSFFLPQVVELLRLDRYKTFGSLVEFAARREKEGLSVWCPHLIKCKDGVMVTFPGDVLYNNDVNADSTDLHDKVTIDDLGANESNNLNRSERRKDGKKRILQNVTWHGHEPIGFIDLKDHMMQSKL